MIWYLLYPLRGTTEAPVLSSSHPLRSAFTRYGRYAARHVITTLLISVAVASLLIYPFPFLYSTDFSNGASNLPHHVWTDAQPLGYRTTGEPDVIMRSIWVHGSYMDALDRGVLLGALELQDQLLGSTKDFSPRQPTRAAPQEEPTTDLAPSQRDSFHVVNGLTNQSWFFHSPLQYWSCAHDDLMADPDIVSTVNAKKTQPTSVNVTLRHSIVFSGKRFEDRRLVAADALVITLIHLRDSPVGRQWERKAEQLAASMAHKWEIYPPDGRSMPYQLYEFQFRPMSSQDLVSFSLAFLLTFFYFLTSLSRLRAVKSKVGLIVTIMVQTAVSILSSFTVCAILKIDLSRVPQALYPVVVFAFHIENVFRIINAVIMTSPEDPTSTRIGHAFGETAHVAVASLVQTLFILFGLSKVVSDGVAAFCAFAAIAIIFDFFFLSTFFLSVLSVDVRRTELGDALAKATLKNKKSRADTHSGQSWTDAVLQGKIALSTRIAGTVVMVGFVVIAQWHFFQSESFFAAANSLLDTSRKSSNTESPGLSLLVHIHQARSPTSWLRLQDHETAREVINVIKPSAHSYTARVYDPLVFVLRGSDRTPTHDEGKFLPAVYDFAHHQLAPFVVTILVILAAVRLLMNYLLWDEISNSNAGNGTDNDPLLSTKSLSGGHALDVILMASSSDGHVVSVGLDRLIRVWDVKSSGEGYVVTDPDDNIESPFPVWAMAIDDDSNWLALLSPNQVMLWNLAERRWGPAMAVDSYGQRPVGFFFSSRKSEYMYVLVTVRQNGTLAELWLDKGQSRDSAVCRSPLTTAVCCDATSTSSNPHSTIITASRKGCVHVAEQTGKGWISRGVNLPARADNDIVSVLPIPAFSACLIVRLQSADFVAIRKSRIIHTFETDAIKGKSLQCFHSSRRQAQCGSMGVGSLSLVYTDAESGDCVIQTYLPAEDRDTICFCEPSSAHEGSSCTWSEAQSVRRRIQNPGVWEALPNNCVLGVRKKVAKEPPSPGSPCPTQSSFRHRVRKTTTAKSRTHDAWEVWAVTTFERQDKLEVIPLESDLEEGSHLFISDLGPVVKVGTGSIAVALGNIIKVVTVGHAHFEMAGRGPPRSDYISLSNRRKKGRR